jgi:molecular chaperone HscA
MLLDSYEHAEEDKRLRSLLVERVEAERILAATRAAMQADADLLDADVRAAIDRAMAKLDDARRGEDHRAIHEAVELLDHAAKPFAEARMNRSLDRAMAGRRVEEVEQKL